MTSPIVITQEKSAFLHTTEGFPPYIMKFIGLLMSVSQPHRRNRLAQTCPVSFTPDWLMENLLCLQNKSAPSVQRFILKSSVCSNATLIGKPGADPGFFLGGGALVSCSTSTPINHIVFFCRIPVVLENRRTSQGGCAPPAPSPQIRP